MLRRVQLAMAAGEPDNAHVIREAADAAAAGGAGGAPPDLPRPEAALPASQRAWQVPSPSDGMEDAYEGSGI